MFLRLPANNCGHLWYSMKGIPKRQPEEKMPVKKIAISVPTDVLEEVDKAAATSGKSRSGYIAELLRKAAHLRRDRNITRAINELFDEEDLRLEQSETADAFSEDFLSRPESAW